MSRKKKELGDLVWVHHSKTEHPAFLVKGDDARKDLDGARYVLVEWESTREREWVRENDIQEAQESMISRRSRRTPEQATKEIERRVKKEVAKESTKEKTEANLQPAAPELLHEPPKPHKKRAARKTAGGLRSSKKRKGSPKANRKQSQAKQPATQKQEAKARKEAADHPKSVRSSELGDFVRVRGHLDEKCRVVGESCCKSHPRLLQLQLWDDRVPPEYFYVPETDIVEQQPSYSERVDSPRKGDQQHSGSDADLDDTTNEDVTDEPSREEIRDKTTEMFKQAFNTSITIGQLIRSIQNHFGVYDDTNRAVIKKRIRELTESVASGSG